MKCATLTIFCLVLVQKLAYASNLDGLRERFPMQHTSRSFSFKCELDETLVVGRYDNVTLPMYAFMCGHHNPCGSSLRCTLTHSELCANPGEYISTISQQIFGIPSICCKYDLTTTNVDEHCHVMRIKGTSTIRNFSSPIPDQSLHFPTQPQPSEKDKSRPAEGKPDQGVKTPIPKQSAGSNGESINVPVEMYAAQVKPILATLNDRVVKSIIKQSNGDWQVTICSLSCKRSTTYRPDPITKEQSSDDSETSNSNAADEVDGEKSDESRNFDSSQESDISRELHVSSESDGSPKSKDPCDVNGDELQALLPNKIHGFNAGFCRTGVEPCKISCRNMYGSEYVAAICRAIRGSGCRNKICLCVTKKHSKDDAREHTDLTEEGDSSKTHDGTSKPKKVHSGGSKSMSKSNGDSSKSKSKSKSNKDDSKSMSKSKSESSKSKSKSKSENSKSGSKSKSENSKSAPSESKSENSKSAPSKSKSENSKSKSKSNSENSKSKSKSKGDNSKSKSENSKSKSKSKDSVESKSQSQSLESESESSEKQRITKPKPSASCFSEDTMVTTRNGLVRMDQLTEGTEVLVRRQMGLASVFEPIQWFIHRDPNKIANFIDIIDDQGHNVTLSPNHLIPISDCQDTTNQHDEIMFKHSIFAKYAKVGMCIFISDNNFVMKQTRILQIRNSVRTGIYSPISASGSLIVNEGVLVSCYSQFQNQLIQQTAFSILNKFASLFDRSSASDPMIDVSLLMQYINYVVVQISL